TTCSPAHGPVSLPNLLYHSSGQASFIAPISGHGSPGLSVIVSTGGPPLPDHFCTRLMTLSATSNAWTSSSSRLSQQASLENLSFEPSNSMPLPPSSASAGLL